MHKTNRAATPRAIFKVGNSIFTEKKLHTPRSQINKKPKNADHAGINETTRLSYDAKQIAGNPHPINVRSIDGTLVAHFRKVDRVCFDVSHVHPLAALHWHASMISRAKRSFPRKPLRIDPTKARGNLPSTFAELGMVLGSLLAKRPHDPGKIRVRHPVCGDIIDLL